MLMYFGMVVDVATKCNYTILLHIILVIYKYRDKYITYE